ncbi:MAG: FAD binding domain-containing protein [Nocardioides sp.]|nr:FAD binding domain-containing protein [Nocardioides sp.]
MSAAAPNSSAFEYQTADCWEEAIKLRALWGEGAKLIAGGQSLVPMINLRLAMPAALIDLNPIVSSGPWLDQGELVIPAMTRHRAVLDSPLVATHFPMLAKAVGLVGNVRVRNRGTIGGSVSHADPTGEIPCVVLAAGGRIVVQGPSGMRSVPADDFFLTYLTTATDLDEVVTEIRLPVAGDQDGWGFDEVTRRFSDFATVEVAVSARSRASEEIPELRVVLGGVADRPLLLGEDILEPFRRLGADPQAIDEVAQNAANSISPESDVHASADYRRRLTQVLTRRSLAQAVGLG